MEKQSTISRPEAWIGVDLDGTLAFYDGWKSVYYIGYPIMPVVERVKEKLAEGIKVKIFTARMSRPEKNEIADLVKLWCLKHIGQELEVTNEKDFGMIELWDDRCKQIEFNTGIFLEDLLK